MKVKRKQSKCYKCVWGTWLSPELVFCMFPFCLYTWITTQKKDLIDAVKDKLKEDKTYDR